MFDKTISILGKVTFMALSLCALWVVRNPQPEVVNYYGVADSSIFKTVAHISPEDVPDATRIYVDFINDVAVYMWDENHPDLEVGDKVTTIDGAKGTVTAIMAQGFLAEFSKSDLYSGLSGTVVRHSNNVVGYASAIKDSDSLYCIWR